MAEFALINGVLKFSIKLPLRHHLILHSANILVNSLIRSYFVQFVLYYCYYYDFSSKFFHLKNDVKSGF